MSVDGELLGVAFTVGALLSCLGLWVGAQLLLLPFRIRLWRARWRFAAAQRAQRELHQRTAYSKARAEEWSV